MEQLTVMQRIEQAYPNLSKGQKRIADYIRGCYDKAAFMTAAKMGQKTQVSESTVVRFAEALHYDGYPALQRALQELIRNKLTNVQRIELVSDLDQSSVLRSVFKNDINNLRVTLDHIDQTAFDAVIDALFSARRIYILGLRSSAPLAESLAYFLSFLFSNVTLVTAGISDVFDQLIRIDHQDVLVAFSFPRYARRTVEALNFAHERHARTVAITDNPFSPLATHADICLVAHSDMASFVDSLVAPLSLINALLVAVSLRMKHETTQHLTLLESVWDRYHVYMSKDTINESHDG